jgi:putative hemolysin
MTLSALAGNILIILTLILLNGALAMSEAAIIAARKPRLMQRAAQGDRKAESALQIINAPNRTLSAIQIGITLIGILAGASGEATIAGAIQMALENVPLLAPYDDVIAIALTVMIITYLSLVVGELVPKRLALNNAESIAEAVAMPLHWLSTLTMPVVRLLSFSTDVLLRILGSRTDAEPPVTEEEIKILIEQGRQAGTFDANEQDIIERVFRLDDQRLSLLMVPRQGIIWLDDNDLVEDNLQKMKDSGHSYYPLCQDKLDNILGLVSVKRLWADSVSGTQLTDLRPYLVEPLYIPENATASDALEQLKQAQYPMAVVINEFGGVEGIITLDDMLEALVGEIAQLADPPEPRAKRRKDGSWLIDGRLPAAELKTLFGLHELPGEQDGIFDTVGGFAMMELGHVPTEADAFELEGLRFEVMDMDGRRIDKLLVTPPSGEEAKGAEKLSAKDSHADDKQD